MRFPASSYCSSIRKGHCSERKNCGLNLRIQRNCWIAPATLTYPTKISGARNRLTDGQIDSAIKITHQFYCVTGMGFAQRKR